MLHVTLFFFFNAPPPTEIYTLSLHDALPIFAPPASLAAMEDSDRARHRRALFPLECDAALRRGRPLEVDQPDVARSEEHTSELQSHHDLVCRLLLEKKKNK